MKDKITNYCALVIAIGGSLLAGHASGQIVLPSGVLGVCGILVVVAGAVNSFYTGKPNK
jgi:hypothetical protein